MHRDFWGTGRERRIEARTDAHLDAVMCHRRRLRMCLSTHESKHVAIERGGALGRDAKTLAGEETALGAR